MEEKEVQSAFQRFLDKTHEIIFEADTPMGKLFDVVLIGLIVLSVITVMLDSVEGYRIRFGTVFYQLEWFFTIIFTIEYTLRLACIGKPLRYATSFFGVVDLLAILPTYVGLIVAGTHYLLVIRLLRVLRVFRVLKVVQYVGEADLLMTAVRASRRKITIFLFAVFTLATIAGSLMYVIEGAGSGFTSIPRSVYWSVVTLTTVGYGDISPQTPKGQALAMVIMLMGYGIIAVPTGIMSVEIARATDQKNLNVRACQECGGEFHASEARYCMHCGEKLV
ncbi:MAG: ion transporter [Candidatus Hydrogenedentes bacterium]|nr:ion transporter [Candidatus Hydrogenedentota bacterium]